MINVTIDARQLERARVFAATISNQLPFATAGALSATARDVQLALKTQTTQSFTDPVAFTKNAFRYDKATKASQVATVYSLPDRPYISTQTFGGQRRWKAYEGFIRGLAQSSGQPLPAGKLIPTSLARNAAGNPKRNLFGLLESKTSTTDRGGFFIGTPRGGNRPPGVYRRSRERLFPYFVVSDSEPRYEARFPFEKVGNMTAAKTFPSHLSKFLERAMATAR